MPTQESGCPMSGFSDLGVRQIAPNKAALKFKWRDQAEALIQPIWVSNRAFRVGRPFQKLTKFQPRYRT